MQSDHRLLARLRAENAVLRALIVDLGGKPPPPIPAVAPARPGADIPALAHLRRLGV